jgi:2,5-diamino-6-(ribosylamino)-4(3H)-pyrimidinone 5'-phosphate reductase
MLPKVIMHNSVSLDGSFINFEVDMGLHYQIAGKYKPDIHLIGSNTIKMGFEIYGEKIPLEEKSDFNKPNRDKNLPYWVIIDTKSSLQGLLHTLRRFEFCKDVIVLISEKTKQDYIQYLQERNYHYHLVGKDQVDLKKAFQLLFTYYKAKTILTDAGRILNDLLLNQGLINEISLVVHPVVVGEKSENLFKNINKNIKLKKVTCEVLKNNYIWLVYKVKY